MIRAPNIWHKNRQQPHRYRRFLWLLFALFLISLCLPPPPSQAQTNQPAYWQYDTPGQLQNLIAQDINRNGTDNFLLLVEDTTLLLLTADGQREWDYTTTDPILQFTPIYFDGPRQPAHIALTTRHQLILLTATGDTVWTKDLERAPGNNNAALALLTSADKERWQNQQAASPAQLIPFDHLNNDRQQLIVVLKAGLVFLLDANGDIQWRYSNLDTFPDDANPQVKIADMDQDGENEIIFAYYTGAVTRLAILEANGPPYRWQRSIAGNLSHLAITTFNATPEIAISTHLYGRSRLHLYDQRGDLRWQRTPNSSITALTFAPHLAQPLLLVGTNSGTLTAFDTHGRRQWHRHYTISEQPDRQIMALHPAPLPNQDIALALTLATRSSSAPEATDVLLLDDKGCPQRFTPTSRPLINHPDCLSSNSTTPIPATGIAYLLDTNHDNELELALARFSTLELRPANRGIPEYSPAESWQNYRLEARPQTVLTTDLNKDGTQSLFIGTDDGRLHHLTRQGHLWQKDLGSNITHLNLIPSVTIAGQASLIVAYQRDTDPNQSQITRISHDGDLLWFSPLLFDAPLTHLHVVDLDKQASPEIIAITADNQFMVFDLNGVQQHQFELPHTVTHIASLPATNQRAAQIYLATIPDNRNDTNHSLYRWQYDQATLLPIATYQQPIQHLDTLPQLNELATHLLVTLANGELSGLNWHGIRYWDHAFGQPIRSIQANQSETLVMTANGNLFFHDLIAANPYYDTPIDEFEDNTQPASNTPRSSISDLGIANTIYQTDLDGDFLADIAIGNQIGQMHLYTHQNTPLGQYQFASAIHTITSLTSLNSNRTNLVIVSDNGIIQLLEARENHPPLVTNTQATLNADRYTIAVTVIDAENNAVAVTLSIWNELTKAWQLISEQKTSNIQETLTWSDIPATNQDLLLYRLQYSDGTHQGVIIPPPAPAPTRLPPSRQQQNTLMIVFLVFFVIAIFVLRRFQRGPTFQARFWHNRITQTPANTLIYISNAYTQTKASPDFLLQLASQTRRHQNPTLANLIDGLFLLGSRLNTGLPIINSALNDAHNIVPNWYDLPLWREHYAILRSLLEAPTITEIALLRPRVVAFLYQYSPQNPEQFHLAGLLPILTNFRDSERVEESDDRLTYLHEASVLLQQQQQRLPQQPFSLENRIVQGLVARWQGLVKAAVEELHGQAQLNITLTTQRIVPETGAKVVFTIHNTGRAAATQIEPYIIPDPAYDILSTPSQIPVLSAGRSAQLELLITPKVKERFRLALELSYDDRQQHRHTLAFADLVHLLPPARPFQTIPNPYSPGVPLREHSALFYGREDLFDFIVTNAQQKALILVGQRRTGKTSALLRLDHHLPADIIPIYIDCQSLGVLPGMAAFFHDIAWTIADVLEQRDILIEVPETEVWQANPAGYFQRRFLPEIQALLPPLSKMLFVFDEFEAFENLVQDEILPPTFFPFLRHMMQHSHDISFVFVGTRRLEEMTSNYWSVLFNIALYRQIDLLSEQASLRLVCEPVAPSLIYDDLALDKIYRVTAGHPYFLQLVCYTLVTHANQKKLSYITISEVNEALADMLRLGEVHFAYIWQRSNQVERALLTALAYLMDRTPRFHPEDIVQYLNQYSITFTPSDLTTGLQSLAQRDILREVTDRATTLYELKIGLVGLWVAQNKSITKLYEAAAPAP